MQLQSDLAEIQDSGQSIYFPYDISFVDCDNSPALRFQVEEHLERLSHFYDRIIDCKVVIRILHKRHVNKFFHVHVQLDVPGRRLAVSREPEFRSKHTEARHSVHDAFLKMTRQLEDFVKMRHDRKVKPAILNSPAAEDVEEDELF